MYQLCKFSPVLHIMHEHKEISKFIKQYNKEGAKILPQHGINQSSSLPQDATYAEIDENIRKVSNNILVCQMSLE